MTPEGKVKAAFKKALDEGVVCYRFMPVQNGMGAPALDFYICAGGGFFAVETKVPGKNLTPRQRVTAEQIVLAGGVVFVVRDEWDALYAMNAIKTKLFKPGIYESKERLWISSAP